MATPHHGMALLVERLRLPRVQSTPQEHGCLPYLKNLWGLHLGGVDYGD